ncbi:putative leucine-rich repeat-containing protein DDB_G0290503 [Saccostrea echinata]|uniref:putative leucine-rich repeat-containing protein DDB_G0290503 n=1 Tax=Saccostrea echinata TaxID=191078 RepID=UPI002A7F9C2F|nr:putative leucine-rich repeat-containing protein DDB_G0290503 [Saccostrea echinata]
MAQNQTKKGKNSKTSPSDKEITSKGEATKNDNDHDQNPTEPSRKVTEKGKSSENSTKKSLEQSKTSLDLTKKHSDQAKNQGEPAKGTKPKTSSTKKVLKIERNHSEAKKILCQMNSQLTELLLGRPSLMESPTDLTRRSLSAIQTLTKDIEAVLDRSSKKSSFLEDIGHLLQENSQIKQMLHKCESNLKSEKELVKFHTNRSRTFQNDVEKLKVEKKQVADKNKELEDMIIELESKFVQTRQSHQNAIKIHTEKQVGLQDKINKYEFSLSSLEDKNSELTTDNQSLKDKIQELEQRNKALEKKCQGYHKDIEKVNHKNKLLENKNKKLQSEADMMNVRNIELKSKHKSMIKESNHSEEKIKDLEEKVQTLTSELETCYTENDELRDQIRHLKLKLSEPEEESDLLIEDYTQVLKEKGEMYRRRLSGPITPSVLHKLRRDDSEHSLISCANSGLSSTLESQGRGSALTRPRSELSDVSFANSSHSDEVPR